MTLQPDDIRNKTFETKFRGLDPDAVKPFLTEIASELGELQEKNQQLTQSLKESQERVAYFTDLKDALNQSIIVAQNAADRVKNNAQHEADVIKSDADKQAKQLLTEATDRSNQILQDASERARHLTIETDDLKKNTRVFHQRLQVLLESQLAMIKTPEWQALLGQADQGTANVGALLAQQQEPVASDQTGTPTVSAALAQNDDDATLPEHDVMAATEEDSEVETTKADTSEAPAAPVAVPSAADINLTSPTPTEPTADSEVTSESDPAAATPEDESPVFQHRGNNQLVQPENITSTDDQNNYDGVTIVFPDENE
ncbi:DivIVA domain-containing protein [Lapidilactobacillus gannanensis]|uniref:DivIVA domain-containing protein n=1 Tax=Lapidilactobacillus gannanensis TaxID=2486002 RepID=A0ABW4BRE8_9LACO|nr:DivIVA domain-containing protein [Lapidilactobacillus gannanensis]